MYSYNNIIDKQEPEQKEIIDGALGDGRGLDFAVTSQQRVVVGVDVLVVENFLTAEECDRLVAACEKVGYTFWRDASAGREASAPDATVLEGTADASESASAETVARAFRVVDTIEANFPTLSRQLYDRVVKSVRLDEKVFSQAMERADELFESDMEGTWVPHSLSENLLLGRYNGGGHFAPHMDGSTIADLNVRSLYTVLVYLNDCPDGGETFIYDGSQCEVLQRDEETGKYVGDPSKRVGAVRPQKGSAAFFAYNVLHEGAPVGRGGIKYILRGDVLYARTPPICTSEADREAFRLYQKARVLESSGAADEACVLLRRVRRLSPEVAALYQLV